MRSRLVQARLDAGVSQAEIAERIGLSLWAISRIENGFRNPSYETMRKWVEALPRLSFDDFKRDPVGGRAA
jgi:transcriptional regulator with XRE-family HTH domain